MTCPSCGRPALRVIYLGLPMKMCSDDVRCCTIFGMFSWACIVLPVPTDTPEGPMWAFAAYEGSYWIALWHWLVGTNS